MTPPARPVFVGLVHNNQATRNDYVVPRLQAMCRTIGGQFACVGWQAPRQPHSLRLALQRDLIYLALEIRWARYRRLSALAPLRVLKSYLFGRLARYVARDHRLTAWRSMSFIETAVTAKHILAWQLFLETDAHHLLCCEDDLIFRDDSVTRLTGLLDSLAGRDADLLYCDLAGGLEIEVLDVGRLVETRTGDRTVYRPPTTNTACAYLLSRGLAAEFMRQITLRPKLRLVGIDWMMNAMFMDLVGRDVDASAIHFSPTLFGHGTFSNDYISWQHDAEFAS